MVIFYANNFCFQDMPVIFFNLIVDIPVWHAVINILGYVCEDTIAVSAELLDCIWLMFMHRIQTE